MGVERADTVRGATVVVVPRDSVATVRGATAVPRDVTFWAGVDGVGAARVIVVAVVVEDTRRLAARAVSSPSNAVACPKASTPRHTQKSSLIPFIPLDKVSKIMIFRASRKCVIKTYFGADRGT